MQRWVRLADLSGEEQLAARLLDAIMRTTSAVAKGIPVAASNSLLPDKLAATNEELPEGIPTAAKGDPATAKGGSGSVKLGGPVPDPAESGALTSLTQSVGAMRRHPPWVPPAPPGTRRGAAEGGCSTSAEAATKRCEGRVHVVGHDQGGNQVRVVM